MRIAPSSLRRIVRIYAWSIGFWMVLAVLTTAQQSISERIYPDRPVGDEIHFWHLLFLSAVRFLTFAVLTPVVFYVVRRLPLGREKPLRAVSTYLVGAVPFVISYACIRLILAPAWSDRLQRFLPRSLSPHCILEIVFGTLGTQISVYVAIVIAAHAYEYFERTRNEELERCELQQALADSELQALKSQLHPHFLFNTLHGISTLIDSDRTLAKAMVEKLSSLLRAALEHGNSDLIRLEEELDFVEGYLDLAKMRLGNRLDVRWNIDPKTREALVPQMILQPLVENAILHGIACCREGGWVEVASRRADGLVELKIQNSVGGKRQGGMGLGLKNTKARLKYLYSDEATLSFAVAQEHIATATLLLPKFDSRQKASPAFDNLS